MKTTVETPHKQTKRTQSRAPKRTAQEKRKAPATMKILVGTDGSKYSESAVDLLRAKLLRAKMPAADRPKGVGVETLLGMGQLHPVGRSPVGTTEHNQPSLTGLFR